VFNAVGIPDQPTVIGIDVEVNESRFDRTSRDLFPERPPLASVEVWVVFWPVRHSNAGFDDLFGWRTEQLANRA
jgi:hypothetical protein